MSSQLEGQLTAALYVGPAVFLLGLAVATVSLALLLSSPGKAYALRCTLITFGLVVAGFLSGAALGIGYFCSSNEAGNLCGLGGVLGTGPLLSGLCMFGGAALARKARRPAR